MCIPLFWRSSSWRLRQATGINSVLNYSVKVFQQAGLEGTTANWADFTIKVVNCLMTIVAMILVDRKGRKFLLKIGTAGIVVGLLGTGFLFNNVEKARQGRDHGRGRPAGRPEPFRPEGV